MAVSTSLSSARRAGAYLLVAAVVLAAAAVSRLVASEADDAASQALIERIATAHRAVLGVQGHAHWRTRHTDEPAAAGSLQEVQFALLFPDCYRLVLSKPGDLDSRTVWRSDGVTLEKLDYQFRDAPPDRKLTPVNHNDREFARLLACFRLDLPVLGQDFTVHAAVVPTGAVLTLAPVRAEIAENVTTLTIQLDAAFHITQLAWSDPQGNHVEVTIDKADWDTPPDPAVFHVGPPAP